MKTKASRRCELCGEGERVAFDYLAKRLIDGRTYTGTVPATRCNKCGEELISGPGLVLFDTALTVQLARAGDIGPQGFRWLRGRARLEGQAFAALLDVSPGTVSRWENGKKPLERRAVALVAALALEAAGEPSSTRELLGLLASGRKLPKRIHLGALPSARS
jgi:DNA-binding transcriptional regulator YiaG